MIVVVGAAAVDVLARRGRFLQGTSNPAAIRWTAGGVGYRIWRRLPAPRLFLSAVGDDPAGRWLEQAVGAEARRGQGKGRGSGRLRRRCCCACRARLRPATARSCSPAGCCTGQRT